MVVGGEGAAATRDEAERLQLENDRTAQVRSNGRRGKIDDACDWACGCAFGSGCCSEIEE